MSRMQHSSDDVRKETPSGVGLAVLARVAMLAAVILGVAALLVFALVKIWH